MINIRFYVHIVIKMYNEINIIHNAFLKATRKDCM